MIIFKINLVDAVTCDLIAKWKEASDRFVYPVTPEDKNIFIKVKTLFSRFSKFSRGNGGGKKSDREQFFSTMNTTLFDLCRCNHEIVICQNQNCSVTNCHNGHHVDCGCPQQIKIPSSELQFIRYF